MSVFNLRNTKRILLYSSFLISIILFIRQCNITYQDTIKYGGTDLRARIVGTRLMNNNLNPYFTKWKPALGERFCDPNDQYNRPVNGVTATPFLLWFQTPLASLSYDNIRIVWWFVQQFLLLLIVSLCLYFYRSSYTAVAAISISFGLLINHPAWIYHAERGQVYILYAAWIAILFAIWRNSRSNPVNIILLGAWLAFGIMLRPTLLVFAIPSFLYTFPNKRILLVASCFISAFFLLLVSNTWLYLNNYSSAMEFYNAIDHQITVPITHPAFPAVIEGTTNITIHKQHPNIVFLASLEYYFGKMGYRPGITVYILICFFISTLLVLLVYMKNKLKLENEQLLMLGTLLYTCAEVCQRLRTGYNLIMWLPASLIMVAYIFYNKKPQNAVS